ncbi:MAG: hypothetical protein CMJ49_05895 [Planctomycetaceae bacterium]|nr:hypothetical protein [Planctomycetaceae bacterium]
MNSDEPEAPWRTILGAVCIVVFCAALCGAFGYLTQTGFFEAASGDPTLQRSVSEPITKQQYQKQTRRGWWIGCAVGGTLGAGYVLWPRKS